MHIRRWRMIRQRISLAGSRSDLQPPFDCRVMANSRKPTVTVEDGITVIHLGPEYESLDEHGLDELRDSLLKAVDGANPPFVVLDMAHTKFFGSAFIEVLFRGWNRLHARKGEFAISSLTPYCREVIEITNLDKLWKIAGSSREAVQHLLQRSKSA